MMTSDNKWGGNPGRSHNLGLMPWNEAGKVRVLSFKQSTQTVVINFFLMKVPSLSHWQMDVVPFYTCCLWQDESSEDCEIFRFERRASQDCVGYQPPGAGLFQDYLNELEEYEVKTNFLNFHSNSCRFWRSSLLHV
jgi:hypothetical protein